MDKTQLCDWLEELAAKAQEKGDCDAAVSALEWYGKFKGFYLDRRSVTHEGMTEHDAIELLAGDDPIFAEQLRQLVDMKRGRQTVQ